MPWYRMVAKVQVIVVSPLWFRSVIMATMLSTKLMAFPLIASSVACLMVLLHYCIFAPGVLFTMSVNWIHCVCGVGLNCIPYVPCVPVSGIFISIVLWNGC
jgi:hypothetical protein